MTLINRDIYRLSDAVYRRRRLRHRTQGRGEHRILPLVPAQGYESLRSRLTREHYPQVLQIPGREERYLQREGLGQAQEMTPYPGSAFSLRLERV
jgi:hypothetical protein